jgi:hypothetical protein
LVILFFTPYLGLVPLAYFIILVGTLYKIFNGSKIIRIDIITYFLFFLFIVLKILQVDLLVLDSITRYYLGIILVFYFLKFKDIRLNIDNLIILFFIFVVSEAILINTFVNPFQYLPNYPKNVFENNVTIGHVTSFMGFYQRPYSIGMNASCSSTIMCGLMLNRAILIKTEKLTNKKYIELIGFITILLFASGVGLTLYFFYYLYKRNLFTKKRIFYFILIVILLYNFYNFLINLFSEDSILQKVSSGYMNYLYEFKLEQISTVLDILRDKSNSIWIGQFFENKSQVIIQSDFAWNDFFLCTGLLGLFVFFLFVLQKINAYNLLPIILLLLSAFHYGGIFTLPGQIIFANILLFNNTHLKT